MTPRKITVPIIQRAYRSVVVTALALGLAATTLAPSAALAGPLYPGTGPTISPDLVPELSTPAAYGTGAIALAAFVKNTGSTAAQPVSLRVVFPDRFTSVKVAAAHESLRCATAGTVITCNMTRPLQGGESVGVAVDGLPPRSGAFSFSLTVDPDRHVREVDESNNSMTVSGMFR